MQATAPSPMSRKKALPSAAARDGVLGRIVTIRGEMVVNTMPIAQAKVTALLRGLRQLSEDYSRDGLPLKVFYFHFDQTMLLGVTARYSTVLVWAQATANLTELEALSRKVATTAHLKSGGVEAPLWDFVRGAGLVPTDGANSSPTDTHTNPSIMNWKDATKALESIVTKVLAQAQAAKLIDKSMADHGVTMDDDFDLDTFSGVGRSLLEKIPHKVLRASLTKEFDSMLSKIK
jgi:hypothetical protein